MTGPRRPTPDRNRCPGCSHPIAATAPWCAPCEQRMPTRLQRDVLTADRALRAARAAAITWLGQHPHATERELQIIALAAQGLDNAEIAERLHVALHTVRDHWKRLSKRWGCTGRTHVVATAFQLGYLKLEITT